jgi:hypothetical protein
LANSKPSNISEYKAWLRDKHDVTVGRRVQNHFESVASRLESAFESSQFWTGLLGNLKNYQEEYLMGTGYDLLTTLDPPPILTKPFNSFLLKTFRANVLENARWPDEPLDGWVLPDNWCSRIYDIVRTSFVVKYFDGVEFMIDKAEALCGENGLQCEVSLEAREEGYYAAHLNVHQDVEIPKFDWDSERIEARVEVQVTTQLQEVIRRLLHKYYEEKRGRIGTADERAKWQWDYTSDEFACNYLGHILHYVEGMIMDVRDRQASSVASPPSGMRQQGGNREGRI